MFKMNILKIVIICTSIIPLNSYIFSFSYADQLLALKMKMQHKFETTAHTYEYLHNHLIQYRTSLELLLEVANNHSAVEEFVSNPIYAFKLIKHLTIDFKKLRNGFTGKHILEFSQIIDEAVTSHNLTFPSVRDLQGICQAITRLQDLYELDEENILSGNFENYWSGSLTDDDLKELQHCYQYHRHFDLDKWLSSEVYYNENDTVEIILLDYYKALMAFVEVTKMTTGNFFRTGNSK